MTCEISRRNFVVGAASVAAIGAVAACGGGVEGSAPAISAGDTLAQLDDVPVGTSKLITTDTEDEIIITRIGENEVKAFSAICTHKGCTVMADTAPLMCPCHGSTYDPQTGENISGPAPEPLPEISVEIVDGAIQVA